MRKAGDGNALEVGKTIMPKELVESCFGPRKEHDGLAGDRVSVEQSTADCGSN